MRKILFFNLVFVLFVTAAMAATRDNIPEPVTDPAQAFVSGSIIARGVGVAPENPVYSPPQRRLMALRAAKVDALREATGIINGVMISGETRVIDASASPGKVSASVAGLVRGATEIKEVYDPVTGEAAVYISIPMTGEGGVVGALMEPLASDYRREYPVFQPLSGAMASTYDALIVDARGTAFKPALINRVVTTAGEVVYDPASVSQEVLTENGAAAYTSGLDKARALLGGRGSKNPLIVRPERVINSTDVAVTADQAGAIAASDHSSGFLDRALVVFVLD